MTLIFPHKRVGTSSFSDLCLATYDLLNVGKIYRRVDLGSDHFTIECIFGFSCVKADCSTNKRWKIKQANWKKWDTIFNKGGTPVTQKLYPLDTGT